MTNHYKRVKQFMELAQQAVPEYPTIPNRLTRELRAKLILEEAFETIEALGFTVGVPVRSMEVVIDSARLVLVERYDCNPVQVIDGCCDLKVVTTGTLIAFGVPDEPFQEEVDNNNLLKFGEGGHRNSDGKWVKPPNHPEPNVGGILQDLLRKNVKHDTEAT